MPRFEAKTKEGSNVKVMVFKNAPDAEDREPFHIPAVACDTDEKWLEIWLLAPASKILHIDGKPQTARLYVDFEVVDKRTGNILYSVRQCKP